MSEADLIERTNRPRPITWAVPAPTPARRTSAASGLYATHLKRVFDIFLALVILPFIALAVAILALATRRDGGPAFYGHTRIGRHGQPFRCWKLRTMVTDSEARLAAHLAASPEAAAEWAATFKLRDDPRITRIGAFLRKTSLDELPQLWNVLRGQMSFVGPRPVTETELARYGAARAAYESVRPGITGLWQVSGRNDLSYDARIDLDQGYVQDISLKQDIRIILKTANSVVGSTGV